MNVCVIGLGYVGLPTAALAAAAGHAVAGYDAQERLRADLTRRIVRGVEREVRDLATHEIAAGRLRICDEVEPADAYIVCVPTPALGDRPDLRHFEDAAERVCRVIGRGELLIVESTVPPGTTERVVSRALHRHGKSLKDIRLAHAPERVLPGSIVRELRENERIIGGRVAADAAAAKALYASFVNAAIHTTDLRTAEFVKVIENAYRDVNIAFANELALFCEGLGIDVWEAIGLANNHPRVNILQPGPGVGGHCIPIDPRFLADANPFATELIQASRRVNDRMPFLIARRILRYVDVCGPQRRIALFGATYKANVNDVRGSPARKICEFLNEQGCETTIFDPHARLADLCASAREALAGADALVLVVDHDAFRAITPALAREVMRTPILIDCRNYFKTPEWQAAGFTVYTLGKSSDLPRTAALGISGRLGA
ncbi:MAG TPA: nucleotide sugar dehydrogenase [Candidatus Baltobacteraceae bacterium]